jgi:integrase/recombinase XerD
MPTWPDKDEALLNEYIQQLPPSTKRQAYRRVIHRFQTFVNDNSPLNQEALQAWLRARSVQTSVQTALVSAQWLDRFLDWLVARKAIAGNPFAELRRTFGCRLSAPIGRALLSSNPIEELEALRPPPRYGSHLGPAMREHVARMRTLGFRYAHEHRFLQFDRFLQQRPGAQNESLPILVREYAALAPSAHGKLLRIHLGRVLARSLSRTGSAIETPKLDRVLARERTRQRCRPYIYSTAEVLQLLEAALAFPSPCAPLRPVTLYTMVVLAYCAGLRVGEIVGLKFKDVDLNTGAIEVHDTKFFKSRRLPLSAGALSVLGNYLKARRADGFPETPEAPLFWNKRRPYSYMWTEGLLREVIRRAGLNTCTGRGGPRVHDLRHTFVVHRMTEWYRRGINPQNRLPYLATYLGHRDIHSTLVYLTITQELLQHASARLRSSQADVVKAIEGGAQC